MWPRREDADTALERERSFLLPEGAAPPPLDALGPSSPTRTLRLRAEHFDTPARDLAHSGITLMRRTGGEDDGWHLTTPGADGARLEHHLPIGSPRRVPSSLRATVADVVGDHPLLPVLRLRTRRRVTSLFGAGGRVRLGLVVEEVSARLLGEPTSRARQWREVEIELASGEPASTLDDAEGLMLAAGLLPAAHGSMAQRAFDPDSRGGQSRRTAFDALLAALCREYGAFQALESAIASDEPDAVHQGRAALRRIRSLLTVFAPTIESRQMPALMSELKWAGALLGVPRDLEVLRALVDDLVAGTGIAEESVGPLRTALEHRHDDARADLLAAMSTPRWDALHERLVALLLTAGAGRVGRRPAATELRRLGLRAEARVERRRRRASLDPSDPTLWHSVRKAAKAARYAHDLVADLPHARPADREAAEFWKTVTAAFGRVQDLVLAAQTLSQVSAEIPPALTALVAERTEERRAAAVATLG
ncbi:CYTH and CHAD domain-containing protein [Tessaracoccus sp. Z1128]